VDISTRKPFLQNPCYSIWFCSFSLLFQTIVGSPFRWPFSQRARRPAVVSRRKKHRFIRNAGVGRVVSPKCGEPSLTSQKLISRISISTQTWRRGSGKRLPIWPCCFGTEPSTNSQRILVPWIYPQHFARVFLFHASPGFAHIEPSNVSSTNQWRTGEIPHAGNATVVCPSAAWTLHSQFAGVLIQGSESVPSD